MASYQNIIVVGNLGKDPEIRYLSNGDPVANFSVAVTETYKNKQGEKSETTTWFRCSAFGKLAEICQKYLKQGSAVLIDGKITTSKYTDKQGIERYDWGVRVGNMQMIGKKESGGEERSSGPTKHEYDAGSVDSDIPF